MAKNYCDGRQQTYFEIHTHRQSSEKCQCTDRGEREAKVVCFMVIGDTDFKKKNTNGLPPKQNKKDAKTSTRIRRRRHAKPQRFTAKSMEDLRSWAEADRVELSRWTKPETVALVAALSLEARKQEQITLTITEWPQRSWTHTVPNDTGVCHLLFAFLAATDHPLKNARFVQLNIVAPFMGIRFSNVIVDLHTGLPLISVRMLGFLDGMTLHFTDIHEVEFHGGWPALEQGFWAGRDHFLDCPEIRAVVRGEIWRRRSLVGLPNPSPSIPPFYDPHYVPKVVRQQLQRPITTPPLPVPNGAEEAPIVIGDSDAEEDNSDIGEEPQLTVDMIFSEEFLDGPKMKKKKPEELKVPVQPQPIAPNRAPQEQDNGPIIPIPVLPPNYTMMYRKYIQASPPKPQPQQNQMRSVRFEDPEPVVSEPPEPPMYPSETFTLRELKHDTRPTEPRHRVIVNVGRVEEDSEVGEGKLHRPIATKPYVPRIYNIPLIGRMKDAKLRQDLKEFYGKDVYYEDEPLCEHDLIVRAHFNRRARDVRFLNRKKHRVAEQKRRELEQQIEDERLEKIRLKEQEERQERKRLSLQVAHEKRKAVLALKAQRKEERLRKAKETREAKRREKEKSSRLQEVSVDYSDDENQSSKRNSTQAEPHMRRSGRLREFDSHNVIELDSDSESASDDEPGANSDENSGDESKGSDKESGSEEDEEYGPTKKKTTTNRRRRATRNVSKPKQRIRSPLKPSRRRARPVDYRVPEYDFSEEDSEVDESESGSDGESESEDEEEVHTSRSSRSRRSKVDEESIESSDPEDPPRRQRATRSSFAESEKTKKLLRRVNTPLIRGLDSVFTTEATDKENDDPADGEEDDKSRSSRTTRKRHHSDSEDEDDEPVLPSRRTRRRLELTTPEEESELEKSESEKSTAQSNRLSKSLEALKKADNYVDLTIDDSDAEQEDSLVTTRKKASEPADHEVIDLSDEESEGDNAHEENQSIPAEETDTPDAPISQRMGRRRARIVDDAEEDDMDTDAKSIEKADEENDSFYSDNGELPMGNSQNSRLPHKVISAETTTSTESRPKASSSSYLTPTPPKPDVKFFIVDSRNIVGRAYFQMPRKKPLGKLFKKYAKATGLELKDLMFSVHGCMVDSKRPPEFYAIRDGDSILMTNLSDE